MVILTKPVPITSFVTVCSVNYIRRLTLTGKSVKYSNALLYGQLGTRLSKKQNNFTSFKSAYGCLSVYRHSVSSLGERESCARHQVDMRGGGAVPDKEISCPRT